ncbi:hypothetical protein [Ancylobacter amanitiformis]|uniref:Uncharacterized protein n=1 Tax=Ancylobacter amanitiformis TaxID=217069 RepID=A0ABU0LQG0_9HYPH|nr:hypothetical protein [Ancylobacter amanitiformis]MDQ0510939.1 hypothetical protein [Ancylobacter amanitiformis]
MADKPKSREQAGARALSVTPISQAARNDIAAQARAKALRTMTAEEWEARRQASGDPVRADVDMAFGPD